MKKYSGLELSEAAGCLDNCLNLIKVTYSHVPIEIWQSEYNSLLKKYKKVCAELDRREDELYS
jgi:hypothetical protein